MSPEHHHRIMRWATAFLEYLLFAHTLIMQKIRRS
jgi:hypothetical protein